MPWGHNTVLLEKLESPEDRGWYVSAAIEYEWSRNVLMNKTWSALGRHPQTLFSGLLDQTLNNRIAMDPNNFEFLGLRSRERDLENALTSGITRTLHEIGPVAFLRRQVHFDVDGDDFYAHLRFSHIYQW